MNAIQFLLDEHNKVRKILADISNPSHRYETKKSIFDELCKTLIRHETMEQKLWYPQLKEDETLNTLITHLISEEKNAEKVMKEFEKIKTPEEWKGKFDQFKRDVEHHAEEEEEKLFPEVEDILTEEELELIGAKLQKFINDHKEK